MSRAEVAASPAPIQTKETTNHAPDPAQWRVVGLCLSFLRRLEEDHDYSPNPDSALFKMAKECAAAWRAFLPLDIVVIKRTETDPARIAELDARGRELLHKATELEVQMALTPVHTKRGYKAKCREIHNAEFDTDDLVVLAFFLGREAERLGVAGVPDFITRRHVEESWPGAGARQAERDAGFIEAYGDDAAA